jgi:hypothetical protein
MFAKLLVFGYGLFHNDSPAYANNYHVAEKNCTPVVENP